MKPVSTWSFLKDHLWPAYKDDLRIGANDAPYLQQTLAVMERPLLADLLFGAARFANLSGLRSKPSVDGNFAKNVWLRPGPGAGHNADNLEVVKGAPGGSVDAVSLGTGGQMIVELTKPANGGLIVYENPLPGGLNPEPVDVEVYVGPLANPMVDSDQAFASDDWVRLGTAGYSAEGDRFLLAQHDLTSARFVRLTDLGESRDPNGSPCAGADIRAVKGFDRAP